MLSHQFINAVFMYTPVAPSKGRSGEDGVEEPKIKYISEKNHPRECYFE